jgi:hypothetical protein
MVAVRRLPEKKARVEKPKEKELTKQQLIDKRLFEMYNHCRFCGLWFKRRYAGDDVCENCRSGHNEFGGEVY